MSYLTEIEKFIKDNFSPSTPENANIKISTEEFLAFLFRIFPYDSIIDHQLTDMLTSLGYERYTYVLENPQVSGSGKNEKIKIYKELSVGWCLKSHLDLQTEELFSKTN